MFSSPSSVPVVDCHFDANKITLKIGRSDNELLAPAGDIKFLMRMRNGLFGHRRALSEECSFMFFDELDGSMRFIAS